MYRIIDATGNDLEGKTFTVEDGHIVMGYTKIPIMIMNQVGSKYVINAINSIIIAEKMVK